MGFMKIQSKPKYNRERCYECGRVVSWKSVTTGMATIEYKLDYDANEYSIATCKKCKSLEVKPT